MSAPYLLSNIDILHKIPQIIVQHTRTYLFWMSASDLRKSMNPSIQISQQWKLSEKKKFKIDMSWVRQGYRPTSLAKVIHVVGTRFYSCNCNIFCQPHRCKVWSHASRLLALPSRVSSSNILMSNKKKNLIGEHFKLENESIEVTTFVEPQILVFDWGKRFYLALKHQKGVLIK